jgi:hypothetical protein
MFERRSVVRGGMAAEFIVPFAWKHSGAAQKVNAVRYL